MTYFLCVELMGGVYFTLLGERHPFDIMTYFLMSWRTVDIMMYFWHHIRFWCHNVLFDMIHTFWLHVYFFWRHDVIFHVMIFWRQNINKMNCNIHGFFETRQAHLLHIPRTKSRFVHRLLLYQFPEIWNNWHKQLNVYTSRGGLRRTIETNYRSRSLCCSRCHN